MGNRKGTRSNLARFCFLRDDENLRLTIIFKLEQDNRTKYKISEGLNIPNYRMSRYLTGYKTNRMSQFQLMILCDYLGVEPDLIIKLKE